MLIWKKLDTRAICAGHFASLSNLTACTSTWIWKKGIRQFFLLRKINSWWIWNEKDLDLDDAWQCTQGLTHTSWWACLIVITSLWPSFEMAGYSGSATLFTHAHKIAASGFNFAYHPICSTILKFSEVDDYIEHGSTQAWCNNHQV